MQETEDYIDSVYKIPIFSLYGDVRKPTPQMTEHFDVLLVDLLDVGTRIYTFLTTLHNNDLPGAFTQLQDMAGRPDLTPEQRALTGRAMMTVAQQMQAAAAAGDKKTAEFLRMYRASR